jgi:uncharacterized protein YuzE
MKSAVKVEYGDDIAYVRLGAGQVAKTIEVAPGLLLDVDKNGEAVGVEVMGLRRRGLAQGVVEVELAKPEPSNETERQAEQRLTNLLFGSHGEQKQVR